MTTLDAEVSPDAVDARHQDEREQRDAVLVDEYIVQEWRDLRMAEFRRHQRIDHMGNAVAAVLGMVLLYAMIHGLHRH